MEDRFVVVLVYLVGPHAVSSRRAEMPKVV